MRSAEIRNAFLKFFEERQHTVVESASLVPMNDQTLLFTNAGMVQFKDALAFREDRGYTRAASCQRCVRAGGKHNDLDNVGFTARHHTFFEMLGNFSFGDYFKHDAIRFAWDFLTGVLKLPQERLWVTVHESDDESVEIWVNEIGFDRDRITRLGDDDNFWTMGDTGPCGASSEIFYDHGPDVPGGPPGTEDGELDRYVEIWNLVFTQYDRSADGTLTPLAKPCVDTGMGFERLAAVLQGVHSNYEIDLFQHLIGSARGLLGLEDDRDGPSLNVIADHIRSTAFLIMDGVLPSNEGRGYVLRRIIRRALRHGHKLGASEPFFSRLVEPLVEEMGDAYPELAANQAAIAQALLREEEQFALTLDQGMRVLGDVMAGAAAESAIPGEVVFKLYDTYGFPVDLTEDIARERGFTIDHDGYEQAMEAQRSRARAASKFKAIAADGIELDVQSEFVGYDALTADAVIVAIVVDGASVDAVQEGAEAALVLDVTPFYAESGGQVGDPGSVIGGAATFEVADTQREGDAVLHIGWATGGSLSVGDRVSAAVNPESRQATRLNHSATHLLHAALRDVLGTHVQQRGSLVDAERLRFDFSHFEAVTADEQRDIERIVNREILRNTAIDTELMTIDAARDRGAMALFGEKYAHEVRVLTMGDGFSMELCGGTHASRTGDIGLFRITSQQGTASGVRRIEAVTASNALAHIESLEDRLARSTALLKTDVDSLDQRIGQLLDENRRLEKEVSTLNVKLASGGGGADEDADEINGIPVVVKQIEGATPKTLPEAVDQIKGRLKSGIVLLAAVNGDKISLVAGITKDLTERVDAPSLLNHVASQVGGKGGGRPDLARGGGSDVAGLNAALASVPAFLGERL